MLADKSFIESLFEFIGKRLKHEVSALLIGGNAMLYYGLRGQTKDMDIVFYKREDITGIIRIIKSHPLYRKTEVSREIPYHVNKTLTKKGTPVLIGDKNIPRFDLFYNYVFSIDTKPIIDSAVRVLRFNLLKLYLPRQEDIIFLKAAAERPQDKEDIIRIVKNLDVDWKLFFEIVKFNFKENRKAVFFALGSLVDINKDEKIIPDEIPEKIAKLFDLKL